MRAIAGVLLVSIGVMFAVATGIRVVTFDSEKTVTLHTEESKEAVFAYTAPGVLSLASDSPRVTIKSSQPDAIVQWGYGASRDVLEYLGKSSALEIEGLALDGVEADISLHEADAQSADDDKKLIDEGGFALDSSDLWLKSGSAAGEATFNLSVDPGVDRSLIAVASTGAAPEITLTWTYEAKTTSPAPLIVIGVLLALIGAVLLLTDRRDRIERCTAAKKAARLKAEKELAASAQTSVLPIFKGDLSAPEIDRSTQREYTAASFGAAILPGTPRTEALRNRDLAESDRVVLPCTAEGNEPEHTEEAAGPEGDADVTPHVTLWECTEPFESDGVPDEGAVDLWKGGRDA